MGWEELQTEKNEQCRERHELTIERMKQIALEEVADPAFSPFFQGTARFLLELEDVRWRIVDSRWEVLELKEMQEINRALYADILGARYESSYANPVYAVKMLGEEYGRLLGLLYAEMRGGLGPLKIEGTILPFSMNYSLKFIIPLRPKKNQNIKR